MSDPVAQITTAIAAIRQVATSDLAISRAAVLEIERQVRIISSVAQNPEVEREGAYLIARALGRYTDRDSRPLVVLDARLQGAIGRFEFALRQLGILPPEESTPSEPHVQSPADAGNK